MGAGCSAGGPNGILGESLSCPKAPTAEDDAKNRRTSGRRGGRRANTANSGTAVEDFLSASISGGFLLFLSAGRAPAGGHDPQ